MVLKSIPTKKRDFLDWFVTMNGQVHGLYAGFSSDKYTDVPKKQKNSLFPGEKGYNHWIFRIVVTMTVRVTHCGLSTANSANYVIPGLQCGSFFAIAR